MEKGDLFEKCPVCNGGEKTGPQLSSGPASVDMVSCPKCNMTGGTTTPEGSKILQLIRNKKMATATDLQILKMVRASHKCESSDEQIRALLHQFRAIV